MSLFPLYFSFNLPLNISFIYLLSSIDWSFTQPYNKVTSNLHTLSKFNCRFHYVPGHAPL
jgi:hypothetical protein